MTSKVKKISLFLLVLLVVSAIDSIRNLPAAALFGSSLIFFFLFAAVTFLIPTALISARLSSLMPEHGGVYHWMTKAFGPKIGMLSIWLQWINTMVWYPTILAFIAGIAAYLFKPELATNVVYLIISILSIFWGLTLINLKGLHLTAKINSICGLIGTLFPLCLLICLGVFWIGSNRSLEISFDLSSMVPNLLKLDNWVSLTAIMASFLGIELSGVHINDIKDPQKNFPKAMLYSSLILLSTMLFGSLAIAMVIPKGDLSLISGVIQVFEKFFSSFSIPWFSPIMAFLIVIGSIGSIINWLISPAKGLYHASEYGFLPNYFKKKNKSGVPSRILITQAILVSILSLVFFLVPNVNSFYWFLTGLSTNLYMAMYFLMFLSSIKLEQIFKNRQVSFKIPFGKTGLYACTILGLIGSTITIFVGFIPPDALEISITKYSLLMIGGCAVVLSPLIPLLKRKG